MSPSSSSSAAEPKKKHTPWASRVLAVLSIFLFAAGSLMLADALRGRDETSARVAAVQAGKAQPPAAPPLAIDEEMYAYLPPEIDFGPVRATHFGADRAFCTAGPSEAPPDVTFERILRTLNPDGGQEVRRSALSNPPSAAAALRMQASVGVLEGVAFLVRLPPSVEAALDGKLRTEKGAIVLAYARRPGSWEYVAFYFPDGLDLDGYVAQFGRPVDALAPLGPEVERVLEPAVAIGGDVFSASVAGGRRPPMTVICRAVGTTGVAMDKAVAALQRRGWQPLPGVEGDGREDTRVLDGPKGQVWITTADRQQRDGMVTVMLDIP